jgi:hypothetical protein
VVWIFFIELFAGGESTINVFDEEYGLFRNGRDCAFEEVVVYAEWTGKIRSKKMRVFLGKG